MLTIRYLCFTETNNDFFIITLLEIIQSFHLRCYFTEKFNLCLNFILSLLMQRLKIQNKLSKLTCKAYKIKKLITLRRFDK